MSTQMQTTQRRHVTPRVDIFENKEELLLIADVSGGSIEVIADEERIVRLGEGLDATGTMTRTAIARGLAALSEYIALIRDGDH